VQIGEGYDAGGLEIYAGRFTDWTGAHPATLVRKHISNPSLWPPGSLTHSYLMCGLNKGNLIAAEVTVTSRDGKLFVQQGPVKFIGGYGAYFNGDLGNEASARFAAMEPRADLGVSGLRFSGETMGLSALGVHMKMLVSAPVAFCNDADGLQRVADGVAASTNEPEARGVVDKCTPQIARRLGASSTTQANNVNLDITTFLPSDRLAAGEQALAAKPLGDLSAALDVPGAQLRTFATPQSTRSLQRGQPCGTSDSMCDHQVDQQGLSNALNSMMGASQALTEGVAQSLSSAPWIAMSAAFVMAIITAGVACGRRPRNSASEDQGEGRMLLAADVE